MSAPTPMYLDGRLHAGPATAPVINPATDETVARIACAQPADVDEALRAAERAFGPWAAAGIAERTRWMAELGAAVRSKEEHLRLCVHLEMGKPWAATAEDFEALVNSLDFYAEEIARIQPQPMADSEGTHEHLLLRQPIGVVGAFLAWNFPLLNLAFKIGPAMAAGCPIIIKPSLKTPLSAYAFGEICAEVGLPAGVVNIIAGDDQQIGDAISSSSIPAMLTLIGSSATGRHIIRTGATSVKRYAMELGGNAPALVFADADLDQAADVICALKFGNAGQVCVAPNRVFVHTDVRSAFTEKVVARVEDVVVGFDRDANIDMGPLIDAGAWRRIHELVEDALAAGAKLLSGGGRPDGLASGSFYAPTVLSDVEPGMRICREEVFGPVVSLLSFDHEADVVRMANDTDAGLASYIFTSDAERSERCAQQLRFGEVQINGVKYGIDLPHCGVKQSGVGVDCSYLALDDYLVPKRVTRALDGLAA